MIAVKGIYQGGNTVKLESLNEPVNEPYEVVVAFINPLSNSDNYNKKLIEIDNLREEVFQLLMKYQGALPANFDYNNELNEYWNERYGNND